MRNVKVKICGVTTDEDVKVICSLGVDAIGFVVNVPSSPRNLSLEKAKNLFKLVPKHVKKVLVTVPQSLNETLKLYEHLKPDLIQVHGEKVKGFHKLKEKLPEAILIRALPVRFKSKILKTALHEAKFFDAILVDSFTPGKHGGVGVTHDWNISRRVREAIYPKPLILAGGLNPENVKKAINTVIPYAVDVSTGVELRPGVKDHQKVKTFINNAKKVKLSGCFDYPELL